MSFAPVKSDPYKKGKGCKRNQGPLWSDASIGLICDAAFGKSKMTVQEAIREANRRLGERYRPKVVLDDYVGHRPPIPV